jgi:hypothetical protein
VKTQLQQIIIIIIIQWKPSAKNYLVLIQADFSAPKLEIALYCQYHNVQTECPVCTVCQVEIVLMWQPFTKLDRFCAICRLGVWNSSVVMVIKLISGLSHVYVCRSMSSHRISSGTWTSLYFTLKSLSVPCFPLIYEYIHSHSFYLYTLYTFQNAFSCGLLQSAYIFCYSFASAVPFFSRKPLTKFISACSIPHY